MSVVLVDTGVANIASLVAAFERLGERAHLTLDPSEVLGVGPVVLPGVGAFGAAMARLEAAGLVEPLRERFRGGRPTLAVCLGLQLLFDESEESPGVRGLGILPGRVRRFPSSVRVPQFGWNRIRVDEAIQGGLLEDGYAYFANSYRATEAPEGWRAAWAEHGGPFVAALERGPLLACQFHPELSGAVGLDLLRRWLSSSDLAGRGS